MTYKSAEYYALERNVTKNKMMLTLIDRARDFNLLAYCDDVTLVGKDRDGRPVETVVRGDLKKSILNLGAQHCIDAAAAIHHGEWEANDFEKAAKI